MIKRTAIRILNALPASFRNAIRAGYSRQFKTVILQNWEKNGKPFPPPHELKQRVIEEYQKKSGASVFIETGTFRGDMIEAQKGNFKKLISIELSQQLWRAAVERFRNSPEIQIIQGNSIEKLGEIVAGLRDAAIFWLDGHYSGGITAKGETVCPVLQEVTTIFESDKHNLPHILLIDDARLFDGTDEYPTIEMLKNHIGKHNSKYHIEINDDIIRCTSK